MRSILKGVGFLRPETGPALVILPLRSWVTPPAAGDARLFELLLPSLPRRSSASSAGLGGILAGLTDAASMPELKIMDQTAAP